MYDIIIVGGGPAGLAAGIFAARRLLKVLLFNDPGALSQLSEASVVDNYPGLFNLHGAELNKRFREHAKRLGTEIVDEGIIRIRKSGKTFRVVTDKKEYESRAVIIATGAKYRKASLPGEDEFSGKGVSYCVTCDGPLFYKKRVVVMGGGDSAVMTALDMEHGGSDVTLIHRRDELRAVESLQKRLKSSKVKTMWNTVVTEIKGDRFVKSVVVENVKTKKRTEIPAEGVFIAIGTVPTSELAKELGLKLSPNGFIVTDRGTKTSVEGVFAAGDCTESPLRQAVWAAAEGALAATSAYLYIKGRK